MAAESRHISVYIARSASEVYAYAADPAHLRRQPAMSDADFDRDTAAVHADLTALKHLLEGA